MTKIFLEVELDLDTRYRRETPAKLNPPPGEPGEAEEIEISSLDTLSIDGAVVNLPADVSETLLEELLAIEKIRRQIEDSIREDALCG